MNDFQEQLERSARRLRDRRNAALDVPPCPRPVRRRSGWRGVAAAAVACACVVAGWTARGLRQVAGPAVLVRTDTVVVPVPAPRACRPDTARQAAAPGPQVLPRPVPAGKHRARAAAPAPVGCPLPPEATGLPEPAELCAYAPQPGRNVLADSVDYALFVDG